MNVRGTKGQLLITARLNANPTKCQKHSAHYGYGLPYSLPITEPVWVDGECIQAAYALGVVKILVHNTPTPMILNDELYNKFLNNGHLDPSITEDGRVASTVQEPSLVNTSVRVNDIVEVQAEITNIGEGYSTSLISLTDDSSDFVKLQNQYVMDGKVYMFFKALKSGECNLKIQQNKMGVGRDENGTEYTLTFNIEPEIIAPTIDTFEFNRTQIEVGETITVSGTISGDTSHPELLKVRVEGMGSSVYMTQDIQVTESNKFKMEFVGGRVSNTTKLTLTQIGKGKTGISVSQEIIIKEKSVAPILCKPVIQKDVAYVSDKVQISAHLAGNLKNPELLKVNITELGDKAQVSKEFTKEIGKPTATAELELLKAGRIKLEVQQTGMGEDKNENGLKYISELLIKDKVAPIASKFLFGKTTLEVGEVLTASASLSGDLNHPELLAFDIQGAGTEVLIEQQPTKNDGYNDVQMKIKGAVAGDVTLTIKQTGMGVGKDELGKTQTVKLKVIEPVVYTAI